jgi:hypothetical protein
MRELEYRLMQEEDDFFLATNESYGRLAIGAYVAGCSTTSGSNIVKMPNVSQLGVNKKIVGAGIQTIHMFIRLVRSVRLRSGCMTLSFAIEHKLH